VTVEARADGRGFDLMAAVVRIATLCK